MPKTIIQNLNSILTTKSELNSIIQENGYDPGEVFSYYPSYIRSIIESGGNDKVSYAYLAEVLESYVTKNGLDSASYASKSYVADYVATYAPTPDLSSYVSKVELDAAGYISSIPSEYITQAELSANSYLTQHQDLSSYATQTYVADYVAAHSGDITTDENLIPKAANTYTLGNYNYQYQCVYTSGIHLKPGSGAETINYTNGVQTKLLFTQTNDCLNISTNTLAFTGNGSSTSKLGWSTSPFYSTYTQKLYLGAANNGEEIRTIFPTYAYVADYVATYAPTVDLSAYVSKVELDAAGYISSIPSEYITDSELSSMSYATTTYVADYVAEHGSGSIQPDWNETDSSYVSYIANKPNIYSTTYSTNVGRSNNVIYNNDITVGRAVYNGWRITNKTSNSITIAATSSSIGTNINFADKGDLIYINNDDVNYVTSVQYTTGSLVTWRSCVINLQNSIVNWDSSVNHIKICTAEPEKNTNVLSNVAQHIARNQYNYTQGDTIIGNGLPYLDPNHSVTHLLCVGAGKNPSIKYTAFDIVKDGNYKPLVYTYGIGNFNGSNYSEAKDLAYVITELQNASGGGSTIIDENIIPKENNTYTLGSDSYQYASTYTSNLYLNGTDIRTSINSMFSYDSATGVLTINTI